MCSLCSFNRKIFANKLFILVKMFYNPKINGQTKKKHNKHGKCEYEKEESSRL